MLKKSFEKCLWEELVRTFGLEKVKDLQALTVWLQGEAVIDTNIAKNLQRLNTLLIDNFWNWNEDELKMQFISPLLYLVDYNDNAKYHPFSQRYLQMRTEEVELSGFVEWVLATGVQVPREPFFFLHEYKKEQGTDNDPLGQILASMLTAQYLNEHKEKPLYGCYVVGKDWYFIVLEGKKFQTTLAYNVTELDKLEKVFQILTHIKELV